MSVNTSPTARRRATGPGLAPMTSATPANDTNAPMSFTRSAYPAPTAIASNAVITGVAAMSSAESPAGIVCSATGHRIW